MTRSAVRPAPETFRSSVARPADFDEFWAATMADVAARPLALELTPAPLRSTDDVEVFWLTFQSYGGFRIRAWYCRPRPRVAEAPFPCLLLVPGYISEPELPRAWARLGYASIAVAPRGKLGSNDRFNPGYPGLLTRDVVDRQTYGYRGFYADAARAVDVALALPEIDPSRIGVHGGSQGGALTITTAALRPDVVTCGAAGAPFLCAMMDSAKLTDSWPYREIADYLRLYPEREPAVRSTLEYFDVVNFAQLVRCPIRVNIGLADDVCPPETAHAMYRLLGGPRELESYPRAGHEAGAHWDGPKVAAFLARHLRPATVPEVTS